MKNPKLCSECKFYVDKHTFFLPERFCAHPKAVDLVTGKAVWRARQLRDPGSRLCGSAGRLWQPRVEEVHPLRAPTFVDAVKESLARLPRGIDPAGVIHADQPGVDPVTAIVQRMKPR